MLDARGRLIERQQYTGTTLTGTPDKTTYSYDHAGNLVKVTDTLGNQTTFGYNLLGSKTQSVDPDAGTSSKIYDNAQRVATSTNGKNETVAYKYDNLNRPTELRDTDLTGALRASWSYDPVGAKGQLASTTRYEGSLQYVTTVSGYDDGYRPTGSTVTIPTSTANGALAGTYTFGATYTTNGQLATRTLPATSDLAAETVTNTYLDQGQLSTMTSPLTPYVSSSTYAYDGLLKQQMLGVVNSRVIVENDFDAATRRLMSIYSRTEIGAIPPHAKTLYFTTYGYDDAGNVTSAAGQKPNALGDLLADQEECFRYDYLRRLTTAWTQTSGACSTPQRTGADPYWREWTYDKIGNRLTQIDKNPSAADTSWTYVVGSAGAVKPHQVKTISSSGPLADTATRTFGYDNAGNTTGLTATAGAAQTLTWDREGHVASINVGANTTTYLYDVNGNRLMRRDGDGTAILYLDGQELKKSPTNTVATTRYYGSVASRTAAGLTWLIADNHGTITQEVGLSGIFRRRLMPFGEARGAQPAWDNDKVFVGGTGDPLGTVHLGAREYDPTTGRFTSIDPILDLLDPQQWHGYAYANNAPSTSSDPTGLEHDQEGCGEYCQEHGGQKPNKTKLMPPEPVDAPFPIINEPGAGTNITPVGEPPVLTLPQTSLCSDTSPMNPCVISGDTKFPIHNGGPGEGDIIDRPWGGGAGPLIDAAKGGGWTKGLKKWVPNPNGRNGGLAHQRVVNEVVQELKDQGYEVRREVYIPTPDGFKPYRYADVVAYDSQGNMVSIHQVGQRTPGLGIPVMRETQAMSDIRSNVKPEVKIVFHPYN